MVTLALAAILAIVGLAMIGSVVAYKREGNLGATVAANVLNLVTAIAAIYLALN